MIGTLITILIIGYWRLTKVITKSSKVQLGSN